MIFSERYSFLYVTVNAYVLYCSAFNIMGKSCDYTSSNFTKQTLIHEILS